MNLTKAKETKTRVCCLYRVSTKGQVDKAENDIPMQKKACHEFAESKGWTIIKEHAELGVSGFKVAAADRDELQEIKREAEKQEFDILLVFMFDRLGRKDNETPFVLKWFVEQGISVWSTVEGEQRFDSNVDDLLNYIRFWQASSESQKTSVRIKTRMKQIVEDGHYMGGTVPFGYRAVYKGRMNKKGRPCALPGFVDSKNEEKTERNAGYLVVSHSGGGMLRQGTRKGIRRTPANRGMRAHWVVKGLDISEDVCHGMCP